MTRTDLKGLFTREDGRWSAFTCICRDEGLLEAGRLKREVRRLLSPGGSVTRGNFLTMVVTSLNWDFSARITEIANDQWSMVIAESWDKEHPFEVRVQCDEVEDGIAAVWYAFWLRKEENEQDRAGDDGVHGE